MAPFPCGKWGVMTGTCWLWVWGLLKPSWAGVGDQGLPSKRLGVPGCSWQSWGTQVLGPPTSVHTPVQLAWHGAENWKKWPRLSLFDIPGKLGGGFVDRGGSCPAEPLSLGVGCGPFLGKLLSWSRLPGCAEGRPPAPAAVPDCVGKRRLRAAR